MTSFVRLQIRGASLLEITVGSHGIPDVICITGQHFPRSLSPKLLRHRQQQTGTAAGSSQSGSSTMARRPSLLPGVILPETQSTSPNAFFVFSLRPSPSLSLSHTHSVTVLQSQCSPPPPVVFNPARRFCSLPSPCVSFVSRPSPALRLRGALALALARPRRTDGLALSSPQ